MKVLETRGLISRLRQSGGLEQREVRTCVHGNLSQLRFWPERMQGARGVNKFAGSSSRAKVWQEIGEPKKGHLRHWIP